MVKDPVCGMEIDPQSAFATREHMGQIFHFCSPSCVEEFDTDPHKYAHQVMGAPAEKTVAGDWSGLPKRAVPSITTGVPDHVDGPVRVEIPIANIDCPTCVQTIERSLSGTPGVQQAHVNYALSKAFVTYDPHQAGLEDLVGTIEKAG